MSLINEALQDLQSRQAMEPEDKKIVSLVPSVNDNVSLEVSKSVCATTVDQLRTDSSNVRFNILLTVLVATTFLGFTLSTVKDIGWSNLAKAAEEDRLPDLLLAEAFIPSKMEEAASSASNHSLAGEPSTQTNNVKEPSLSNQDNLELNQDTLGVNSAVAEVVKIENKKSSAVQVPPLKQTDSTSLLIQAQVALEENRLTLPEGNNARYFFHKVLLEDADNPQAREGTERVAQKYKALVLNAIDKQDVGRANYLLDRSELAGLSTDTRNNLRLQLDNVIDVGANKAQLIAQPSVSKESYGNAAAKESVPAETQNNYHQASTAVKSFESEQQVIATAQSLVDKGELAQARAIVQPYVQEHRNSVKSAVYLMDQLLAQGDHSIAASFESALPDIHIAKALVKAKLVNKTQGTQLAIEVLENNTPAKSMEREHFSYLAALYQRSDMHEKAHKTYSGLTQFYPDDVTYVLGFAVSADSLYRYDEAYSAYAKVLSMGHSNPKIIGFVRTRMNTMTSENLAEAGRW